MTIVHVRPDYIDRHELSEWERMTLWGISQEEGVEFYTPLAFQDAFNDDMISDLGYIFFFD